jgi:hypothetical protein
VEDGKTRECWEITRDDIPPSSVTWSGVIEVVLPLAVVAIVLQITRILFKYYFGLEINVSQRLFSLEIIVKFWNYFKPRYYCKNV